MIRCIITLGKSNLDKTNIGRPDLTEVGMSKVNRREVVQVGLGGVAGVAGPVALDALRGPTRPIGRRHARAHLPFGAAR